MASPNFWRDLADEFRAVPDRWTLCAEWYADAEIPVLENWLVTSSTAAARNADAEIPGLARWLVTGSTAAANHSFEALARRAAIGIAGADTRDLLAAWLDQLRRERFRFKPMRFTLIKHRDGSESTLCVGGQIPLVCEVSADYCKTLESRALQSDFEEQKRSHGRNRALVHRQFEAQRKIADLKSPSPEHAQTPENPSRTAKRRPRYGKTRQISPSERRARTVANLIEELNILRPQMYGESEYAKLEQEHRGFLTFKVAAKHPELKEKVINVQAHRRHFRLAQELAGAYHGKKLSTLQTDWKKNKPKKFRRVPIYHSPL